MTRLTNKKLPRAIIYGGGTITPIRPHLALCAPAYGTLARTLANQLSSAFNVDLRLTKMAGGRDIETNDDLQEDIDKAVADPTVKCIVMTAAVCDFDVDRVNGATDGVSRLSSEQSYSLDILPAGKLLRNVRSERKDIFLVACKTTTGATIQEQFDKALTLLKKNSCNLVLANDLTTRVNMVVTPEMASYAVGTDRDTTVARLASMVISRSGLSFTRTNVLEEEALMVWDNAPSALHTVVDWLVERGAYPAFHGVTVGHFGWLQRETNTLYSSRRKYNYNIRSNRNLVQVEFNGPQPTAYGYKPSAGVRSQYAVFQNVPAEYDCIVHFHCPLRKTRVCDIVSRQQWPFECGSEECGENTVQGLRRVSENIFAVMLENHGPNIVFRSDKDPKEVIDYIDKNFDLSKRAGAPE